MEYFFVTKTHKLSGLCFHICLQVKTFQDKTSLKTFLLSCFVFFKTWNKNLKGSPTMFDVLLLCHHCILHFCKVSFSCQLQERNKRVFLKYQRDKSNQKVVLSWGFVDLIFQFSINHFKEKCVPKEKPWWVVASDAWLLCLVTEACFPLFSCIRYPFTCTANAFL